MDGKVLASIFESEWLSSDALEQLKALGYIE